MTTRLEDLVTPTLTSGDWRYFSPSLRVSVASSSAVVMVDGLDIADQRHRDMAGQVDLIFAGQISDLEDGDLQRVERSDLVIVLERRRGRGASGA